MEHFAIIVNGWKALTIITKSSNLDVAAVLDLPLVGMFLWYLQPISISKACVLILLHSVIARYSDEKNPSRLKIDSLTPFSCVVMNVD